MNITNITFLHGTMRNSSVMTLQVVLLCFTSLISILAFILQFRLIAMDRLWRDLSGAFVIRRLAVNQRPTSPLTRHNEQTEPLIDERADEETSGIDNYYSKGTSSRLLVMSLPSIISLVSTSILLGLAISLGIHQLNNDHSMITSGNALQTSSGRVMVSPCGSTPSEARTNGCHFDVISFNWLPTECYDADLSIEFDQINALEWFLDPNRTQPLTHDQIMTGEHTGLYVNWEYHLRHCTAMWKKMHRTMMGESGARGIDSYISSYEHTKHCEHMLLGGQGIAFDAINTRIRVKYPDCEIL